MKLSQEQDSIGLNKRTISIGVNYMQQESKFDTFCMRSALLTVKGNNAEQLQKGLKLIQYSAIQILIGGSSGIL